MKNRRVSRRDLLKGTGVVLAGAALSTRVMASAPPPEAVTPALIEAAKKEGQVSYYTSTDLPVAEKVAKAFEAKYSGISVRVERSGAERVFQRIGQEYSSNIHAVDVVILPTPRISSSGNATAFCCLTYRRMSPNSIPSSTRMSTASLRAGGCGSASSPTTPIW